MKKLALLAAIAFLAAACGSDSDDSTTEAEATATAEATAEPEETATEEATEAATEEPTEEATAEATEVALTASFRGVTEDTITIGVSMLDFGALVSSGLSAQGWGDQQLVWETFIADLNSKGGINGRMVEAVYDFYNPVIMAEAETACLRLTGDQDVFAVLGGFLGPAEPATTCVVGDQETILVGDGQNSERKAKANAPWLQSSSDRERRIDAFMTLLGQEGHLDGVRLAVVGNVEAETEYEAAPAVLAEHGVEPVVVALNDATSGDILAEDAGWEPIAEKIRAEEANSVLLIGATSGGIRNIARAGLDVEIWALDAGQLNNLGASVDPADADGTITINSLTDTEAWEGPLVAECREIFDAANPDAEVIGPADIEDGQEQWYNPIMAYCRWLRLFVMVAEEAGADLTHESFAAAAATFDQFALPGIPFNSLGPDKTAASDSFRLSEFDAGASGTGDLAPLTEIVDATP